MRRLELPRATRDLSNLSAVRSALAEQLGLSAKRPSSVEVRDDGGAGHALAWTDAGTGALVVTPEVATSLQEGDSAVVLAVCHQLLHSLGEGHAYPSARDQLLEEVLTEVVLQGHLRELAGALGVDVGDPGPLVVPLLEEDDVELGRVVSFAAGVERFARVAAWLEELGADDEPEELVVAAVEWALRLKRLPGSERFAELAEAAAELASGGEEDDVGAAAELEGYLGGYLAQLVRSRTGFAGLRYAASRAWLDRDVTRPAERTLGPGQALANLVVAAEAVTLVPLSPRGAIAGALRAVEGAPDALAAVRRSLDARLHLWQARTFDASSRGGSAATFTSGFKEDEHPRADGGQFAPKGGGGEHEGSEPAGDEGADHPDRPGGAEGGEEPEVERPPKTDEEVGRELAESGRAWAGAVVEDFVADDWTRLALPWTRARDQAEEDDQVEPPELPGEDEDPRYEERSEEQERAAAAAWEEARLEHDRAASRDPVAAGSEWADRLVQGRLEGYSLGDVADPDLKFGDVADDPSDRPRVVLSGLGEQERAARARFALAKAVARSLESGLDAQRAKWHRLLDGDEQYQADVRAVEALPPERKLDAYYEAERRAAERLRGEFDAGRALAEVLERGRRALQRASDPRVAERPVSVGGFKVGLAGEGGLDRPVEVSPGLAIGPPRKVESEVSMSASSKRKLNVHGLTVVVENPAGSVRRWGRLDGAHGETQMQLDYGFVEDHLSSDGEELDCYVGPDPRARFVYVVHQRLAPEYLRHDEDKVFFWQPSAQAAEDAYFAHRSPGERELDPGPFGGMSTIPVEEFLAKLVRRRGTGKIRAERGRSTVVKMRVEQRGPKWVVTTRDGSRVLGTHDTREDAERQLRLVEARKHRASTMAAVGVKGFADGVLVTAAPSVRADVERRLSRGGVSWRAGNTGTIVVVGASPEDVARMVGDDVEVRPASSGKLPFDAAGVHVPGHLGEERRRTSTRGLFGDLVRLSVGGEVGRVSVGRWDRWATPGRKPKDGVDVDFNVATFGQMVDNWLRRGDVMSVCYNHQSAYVEENGAPAPALAYCDAACVVEEGRVVKFERLFKSQATAPPDVAELERLVSELATTEDPRPSPDGLWWYRCEVTPIGQQLLPSFKFLSPMFVTDGEDEFGRPQGYTLYDGAATNTPFQGGCLINFDRQGRLVVTMQGHYGAYGDGFEACTAKVASFADDPAAFCEWVHEQSKGVAPGVEDARMDAGAKASPPVCCALCGARTTAVMRGLRPVLAEHVVPTGPARCDASGRDPGDAQPAARAARMDRGDVPGKDAPVAVGDRVEVRSLADGQRRTGTVKTTDPLVVRYPDGSEERVGQKEVRKLAPASPVVDRRGESPATHLAVFSDGTSARLRAPAMVLAELRAAKVGRARGARLLSVEALTDAQPAARERVKTMGKMLGEEMARRFGLEPGSPRDKVDAVYARRVDEARRMLAEEEDGAKMLDEARRMDEEAQAYEDAYGADGGTPDKTPHVAMRRVAAKMRAMAKLGDRQHLDGMKRVMDEGRKMGAMPEDKVREMARLMEEARKMGVKDDEEPMREMARLMEEARALAAPFGGTETPEEEAAEEAMKDRMASMKEEEAEARQMAKLAVRFGLNPRTARRAEILQAVTAGSVSMSQLPTLVDRRVGEALKAEQRRQQEADAQRRAEQLGDDAVAGGYPADLKRDLVAFARANYEAAKRTVAQFTDHDRQLFSRVTRQGAPAGRARGGDSGSSAPVVQQHGAHTKVTFTTDLAAAAKKRAKEKGIKYERALEEVHRENPEMYEAYLAQRW